MPDRDATQTVLACYRCGGSLQSLSLPLARLDLCPGCSVELHVCRMCHHYAPTAPDACDEEDAPEARNKTTANFCDYFDPNPQAHDGSEKRADNEARTQLESLFGDEPESSSGKTGPLDADPDLQQAEDLFKK